MADNRQPIFISRVQYYLEPPYLVLEMACRHCDHGGVAGANTAADAVERWAELFTHAAVHIREAHPEMAAALDKAFFSTPPTAKWPNE